MFVHARLLFLSLVFLIGGLERSHAAVPSDLYIEASAVTAYCGGQELRSGDLEALASEILRATGEQLSADEVMSRIVKAKTAFGAGGGDCRSPFAQVHMHFFRSVVFPGAARTPENAATAG